jgi:hypothetical protein
MDCNQLGFTRMMCTRVVEARVKWDERKSREVLPSKKKIPEIHRSNRGRREIVSQLKEGAKTEEKTGKT